MKLIRQIVCSVNLLLGLTNAAFVLAQTASSLTGAPSTLMQMPVQAEATMPLTGTLFFSREQRERMDRARKSGRVSVDEETTNDIQRSIVNGFVKRSDGATSVWVDGRMKMLVSGDLADQIQPMSVGTTLSDVRLSVADHVSPLHGNTSQPHRSNKKKASAKEKAR